MLNSAARKLTEVMERLIDGTGKITSSACQYYRGTHRSLTDGSQTISHTNDKIASRITRPTTSRTRPADPFLAAFHRDVDVTTRGFRQPALWRTDNNLLYRADNRPPEVIFREGFQTRGTASSLLNHESGDPNSGFVATTRREALLNQSGFRRTYIYTIDVPGGVDLGAMASERVYQHIHTTQQEEIAFPGGIRPEFIVGARLRSPLEWESDEFIPNPHYRPRESR
ncbi:hypothetical protein ACFQZZ_03900 [Nocardia sp. GCM10030253]|uniref:scabin-related ADP-ribosyltransferase n=1 Tax=Nocardia sp. GCM10030253 TaxID=3273404 RepID=UPI003624E554